MDKSDILLSPGLTGLCLEMHTTSLMDPFSGSGSEKVMILAKIQNLACEIFYLNTILHFYFYIVHWPDCYITHAHSCVCVCIDCLVP